MVDNVLQAVQTFSESGVGMLLNTNCFLKFATKKYENFQNQPGQLGTTILLQKPYFVAVADGAAPVFQSAQQRFQPLVCDQIKNVAHVMSQSELVFNFNNNPGQIESLTRASAAGLGAIIERYMADLGKNAGYRFFGSTSSYVNTYQQLNLAYANFAQYGMSPDMGCVIMDNSTIANIKNTQNAAFTLNFNNQLQDSANSWEIGKISGRNLDTYASNMLPIHHGGYAANNSTTLTVVSVSSDGLNITFSVPSAQTKMLAKGDMIQFSTGADGDLFFVTRYGRANTGLNVQARITADADSTGSGPYTVVATVSEPMIGDANSINQLITRPLAAGDTATAVGPHRVGLMLSMDAVSLAMPKLPDTQPYTSSSIMDETTGASMLSWHGWIPEKGNTGLVQQVQYGGVYFDDYVQRIILPI
jgi:hypothetical protein